MKKIYVILIIFIFITSVLLFARFPVHTVTKTSVQPSIQPTPSYPLAVSYMRQQQYPGSDITIEQTLPAGTNYDQYIASYKSEGLKIYALLTIPHGDKPKAGWPVVVFNHGYIPPEIYRTTERYIYYVDTFARNGYIVFKPDYRGNGFSEGQPEGAYYSPAYTIDDLNAISSIKKYKEANPDKIGVWGHSMGGNITLRDLVVNTKDIKAAVIWGGVVGSYNDLMNNWQRRVPYQPSARELALRNRNRQRLTQKYGTPQTDPNFWNSIDPTQFVNDITAPIQIHHGTEDEEVPLDFSQNLYNKLKNANKNVELFTYEGADHNISPPSFNAAMDRSLKFFDKYLKT